MHHPNFCAQHPSTNPTLSAKRYERLLKAHDISVSAPRRGAAAVKEENNSDGEKPKASASKKRKRGTDKIKKDDDDEDEAAGSSARVKKEEGRAMKKEKGVKKEESDDDDVMVKKEVTTLSDDGSFTHHNHHHHHHHHQHHSPTVAMSDIPEFPGHAVRSVGNDDDDDRCCLNVDERRVPSPAPTSWVYIPDYNHRESSATPLPPPQIPKFGYDHAAATVCRHHSANPGCFSQTMTPCPTEHSLSATVTNTSNEPAVSPFGTRNWGRYRSSASSAT
ncbi:hypothetical protein VTK26DRAFT_7538 [Humicola hyalothermophila]